MSGSPGGRWINYMAGIPKVLEVYPQHDQSLRVLFDNGVEKVYDCKPIIERFDFQYYRMTLFSSLSMWIAADMGFPGTPISTLANMSYGRMVL